MATYKIVKDGRGFRVRRVHDNADLGYHDAKQEAEAHVAKLAHMDEREREARAFAAAQAGGNHEHIAKD